MVLVKLEDFYPNYRQEIIGGDRIKGLEVYAGKTDEKIGTICDDVVDLTGRFRYLVVDTSLWGIKKKILLPVGSCRLDCRARRIYAPASLDKKQVEGLPEYADGITVDRAHQEDWNVQALPPPEEEPARDPSENSMVSNPAAGEAAQSEPQTLKLYAERAFFVKSRRQTGEIAIGKRIETETVRISIPIEKERLIVERTTPTDGGTIAGDREIELRAGEVIRIKLYEETAEICKETFPREIITLKKEVERETIDAEVSLRREELEVNTCDRPVAETD